MKTATAAIPAPLHAIDECVRHRKSPVDRITGTYTLPKDEPWLAGHFPGQPIYPGVFVLESVRQAVERAFEAPMLLSRINSVRFHEPLFPGDAMELDGTIDATDVVGVRGEIRLSEHKMASFDLVFAPSDTIPVASGRPPTLPASSGRALSFSEIVAALPHRWPMLLVDAVDELSENSIRTRKLVSATEPWFGRLEGIRPVFPQSLLLESFGQSAALMWLAHAQERTSPPKTLMLVGARQCQFVGVAEIGEIVHHEVLLESVIADTAFASGRSFTAKGGIAVYDNLIAVRRPFPRRTLP